MPICGSFIIAVRLNTCMLGSCTETRKVMLLVLHGPIGHIRSQIYHQLATVSFACVDHVSEFDSDCYSHFVDKLPV